MFHKKNLKMYITGNFSIVHAYDILQTEKIPSEEVDNFRFTVEIHMGGCGAIELSIDWSTKIPPLESNSAVLGLKFCKFSLTYKSCNKCI